MITRRLLLLGSMAITTTRCVPVKPAVAKAIPIAGTEAAYEDSKAIKDYRQPHVVGTRGQPASCCGVSDAYWADEFERSPDGTQYVAIVTDPRDDDQFAVYDEEGNGSPRAHIPIGTRILIPNDCLITFPEQPPNKTGHGWVWAGRNIDEDGRLLSGYKVWCYLAPPAG